MYNGEGTIMYVSCKIGGTEETDNPDEIFYDSKFYSIIDKDFSPFFLSC